MKRKRKTLKMKQSQKTVTKEKKVLDYEKDEYSF